jgi:NAD(P)-dependent dehydrogenase (short-subunit alcohol dehydrogenase family)
MSETSAVVIGASGGIGSALVRRLEAAGHHAVVHALSRSGTGLDLEDEASIAAAVARIAEGPPPALVIVATGVLHGDHSPERSYRALTAEHLMRDYRLNAIGPALVAKHILPLMPRQDRSVFGALSARVGSIGDNRLGGWAAGTPIGRPRPRSTC